MEELIKSCSEKMDKAIDSYSKHLNTVRTGRANPNLLDRIEIDYYGAMTPVNQIASISVVEGRTLVVKPYDASTLKAIEKAINTSDLGLPPQNDGSVIRVSVPQLTEETRKSYCKEVSKFAEEAKVNIRNVRREYNDILKKDKTIPEDSQKDLLDQVQKLTEKMTKKIDEIADKKEKEIMTI